MQVSICTHPTDKGEATPRTHISITGGDTDSPEVVARAFNTVEKLIKAGDTNG